MTPEDIQLYVIRMSGGRENVGIISPTEIRIDNKTKEVKRQYEFICMDVENFVDQFVASNEIGLYYKPKRIPIEDWSRIRKL